MIPSKKTGLINNNSFRTSNKLGPIFAGDGLVVTKFIRSALSFLYFNGYEK
ncbi:hypothetical protein FAEUMB_19290 [Faecalimonas umbilicata]|uniref:Uncharacterized protein n=1 Tax=Faecalimonas umbilicata TaxID=1912855 RepID=A0ABQ0QYB7_9FIRM|nr:hypothetical protein FAEUMB_19290 [Faecalimonas umbilicata]